MQTSSAGDLIHRTLLSLFQDLAPAGAGFWEAAPDARTLRRIQATGSLAGQDAPETVPLDPSSPSRGEAALKSALVASLAGRAGAEPVPEEPVLTATVQDGDRVDGVLALEGGTPSPATELRLAASALAQGITLCRVLQDARRISELNQSFLDSAPVPLIRVDTDGRSLHWNREAEALFRRGRTGRPPLGQPLDLFSDLPHANLVSILAGVLATGRPATHDVTGRTAGGGRLSLRAVFTPFAASPAAPAEVFLSFQDLSRDQRTAALLTLVTAASRTFDISIGTEAGEAALAELIGTHTEAIAVDVWDLRPDGRSWLRAVQWPTGRETPPCRDLAAEGIPERLARVRGPEWFSVAAAGDVTPLEVRDPADRVAALGLPVLVDGRLSSVVILYLWECPPETERFLSALQATIAIYARLRAQTADRAALAAIEEARRHSQKLETVGLLTEGIAHDFNNVLAVILGNCELAGALVHSPADVNESLECIRAAAERAASLVRQLGTFGRKTSRERPLLDLESSLTDLRQIVSRALPENIAVELQTETVHLVRVDRTDFEQIVLNLAVNARDAMPEGGRLHILAANVKVSPPQAARRPGVRSGEFVRLVVADTGTGMDEETAARALEPFFTTKAPGRGTGLGLANVQRIVAEADGFVELVSKPGQGTAVAIYFPRAPLGIAPREVREPVPPDPGGSESILLVEDDTSVRAVVQRLLEVRGYRVVAVPDVKGARELLEEDRNEIDLLITDQVMPDGEGHHLLQEARRRRPDMATLLISGYLDRLPLPDDEIEAADRGNGRGSGGSGERGTLGEPSHSLLGKPFRSDELAQAVRRSLDAR